MLLFSGQLYEYLFFHDSFHGICGIGSNVIVLFQYSVYIRFVLFVCRFFVSFLGFQVLCFVFLDS